MHTHTPSVYCNNDCKKYFSKNFICYVSVRVLYFSAFITIVLSAIIETQLLKILNGKNVGIDGPFNETIDAWEWLH